MRNLVGFLAVLKDWNCLAVINAELNPKKNRLNWILLPKLLRH